MTDGTPTSSSPSMAPLDVPGRAMTIGAHPDDAEFGAGATLARWASLGTQITMVILTDGSKGAWDPDTDQQELIETRIKEQANAADVLGAANVIHLEHVDGELEYSMNLRLELARHIRTEKPDVVLTHDPWQKYQLHPDHRVTGTAALDAVVTAREPLAARHLNLPAHRPSTALLWSADAPDHAEPMTDTWFESKIDALMCHTSQGTTTMSGAETGAESRLAFAASVRIRHARDGELFGHQLAEIFKLIVP